jgi:hypothetical protein
MVRTLNCKVKILCEDLTTYKDGGEKKVILCRQLVETVLD